MIDPVQGSSQKVEPTEDRTEYTDILVDLTRRVKSPKDRIGVSTFHEFVSYFIY